MGETDTLRFLAERFGSWGDGVLIGVGDDSAVLELSKGSLLVASTDTLVENIHFLPETMTPRQIGKRAVCVSLSDLAAMGAVPRFLLCSLGYPRAAAEAFAEDVARGVADACDEFGVELVGGNLSESAVVFVNMTSLGEISGHGAVARRGAASGDDIYATGTLGDSALGLAILSGGDRPPGFEVPVSRHLEPVPRLAAGGLLGRLGIASSMIDVSDGLFIDLGRITSDHGLGARVMLEDIPLSPEFSSLSPRFSEDAMSLAVSGGEDYELLFTAPPENAAAVTKISRDCGIAISKIGSVTEGEEISFLDGAGRRVFYEAEGFRHFA